MIIIPQKRAFCTYRRSPGGDIPSHVPDGAWHALVTRAEGSHQNRAGDSGKFWQARNMLPGKLAYYQA